MNYAMTVGALLWISILASCVLTEAIPQQTRKTHEDQNVQMENGPEAEMQDKRGWRSLHQSGWGKRAWRDMPMGWGKRQADEPLYPIFATEKKAWQKLQGSWGKRMSPENDEWTNRELVTLMDTTEPDLQQYEDEYLSSHADELYPNEDKRAWKEFNGGWGKRASDWNSFRGSWGKRDPAWNKLKNIWG